MVFSRHRGRLGGRERRLTGFSDIEADWEAWERRLTGFSDIEVDWEAWEKRLAGFWT